MKSHLKLKWKLLLLITLLSPVFFTCKGNVGLGSTIDITPPTVRIDSPEAAGAPARGSFVIKGKAEDDTQIKSVHVMLLDSNGGLKSSGHAELSDKSGASRSTAKDVREWWILFENKMEGGKHVLPDGEYTIKVDVVDESGKTATTTTKFTIDNTPPVLVLHRPSTVMSSETPDRYGKDLWLEGMSADDSGVSKIVMRAYADKEGTTLLAEKTLENVPPTVEIKVGSRNGSNNGNKKDDFYNTIYNKRGKNPVYCTIEIFDNAKQYTKEGASGEGNSTTSYYLYAPLYDEVFSLVNTNDIYRAFAGFNIAEDKGLDKGKIISLLSKDNATVSEAFKANGKEKGSFTLDPDASPEYELLGFQAVAEDAGVDSYNTIGKGSTITVQLSAGLDKAPLDKNSFVFCYMTKETYEKYRKDPKLQSFGQTPESLFKDNSKKEIRDGIIQLDAKLTPQGTSYIATYTFKDKELKVNHPYVFIVAGREKKGRNERGNQLRMKTETAGNCIYGFKVAGLVDIEPPRILPEYPQEGVLFDPAKKISAIIFDASGIQEARVHYRYGNGEEKEALLSPESGKANMYTAALPAADLKEGQYEVWFTAIDKAEPPNTNTGENSKITVMYDKAAPDIKNVYVNGTAIRNDDKLNVNLKNIRITGEVIESHGLEYLKIKGDGVPFSSSGDTYSFDRTLLLEDENHTIKIEARDKAGKVSSIEFTLCVDTTAPTLHNIKLAHQENAASGGSLTTDSSVVPIVGIADDGANGSGIAEVQCQVEGGDWKLLAGRVDNGKYAFTDSVVIATGEQKTITLQAIDRVGNKSDKWQYTVSVASNIPIITVEVLAPTPSENLISKDNGTLCYLKGITDIRLYAELPNANGGEKLVVEVVRLNENGQSKVALEDFFADPNAVKALTIKPDSSGKDASKFTIKDGVADGEYRITAKQNKHSKTVKLIIDNTPPKVESRVPFYDSASSTEVYKFTSLQNFYGTITDGSSGSGVKSITAKIDGANHELIRTGGAWKSKEAPSLNEGMHTLVLNYEDNLGNKGSSSEISFVYDDADPVLSEITVNSETSAQVLVGVDTTGKILKNIEIKGNVQDNVDMKFVRVSIGKPDGTYKKDFPVISITTGSTETSWTQTITKDDLKNSSGVYVGGPYIITITAEDAAGRRTIQTRSVEIDSEKPKVTVEYPQVINKTITIKGTSSDNVALQFVKIVKKDGSELIGVSESSGDDPNKAEFSGTKAYNWSFKLDTTKYTDNQDLTLKAIAKDKAGLDVEKEFTLKINQDSDRPRIVITNANKDPDKADTYTLTNGRTLYGSIQDDDGAVKELKISKDGGRTYESVTNIGGGWQYAFDKDGTYTITFKATDSIGTVFPSPSGTPPAEKAPYVYYEQEAPANGINTFNLVVDNTEPECKSIQFTRKDDYSGLEALKQNAKFKAEKIYVQIKAFDANGIKAVKLAMKDKTVQATKKSASGTEEIWQAAFDFSAAGLEGTNALNITLIDNAGKKAERSTSLIIDHTPPTASIDYPKEDSPQSGKITISGMVKDVKDSNGEEHMGSGVNPQGTKWLIVPTANGVPTATTTGWHDMKTSTVANWNFEYNFTTAIGTTEAECENYGTKTGDYYTIPVYVLTEDTVGNKAVTTFSVLYNPDGTKPIVHVLSPTKDAIVGGTIQIFGSSTVAVGTPDHIGEVHIQFSKTGNFNNTDCIFNGKDWWNNEEGVLVPDTDSPTGGGASWRMTVNEDGKLNPPTGDKWPLWFRLRAKNKIAGTIGAWSEPIEIAVDKSAPTIGSPTEIQLESMAGGNNKVYVPNMWISKDLKLTGSLHDESGIKELMITGDLEGGTPIGLAKALSTGWICEDTHNKPTGAGVTAKNYLLNLPLDLDKLTQDAKNNKAFKVKIRIVEDTNKNLSADREFTFRYDIENPVGDFGTLLYTSNAEFGVNSITDSNLVENLGGSHTGKKMLVGNTVVTPTGINGHTVSFTPAITAGRHNYIVLAPDTIVKDNTWTIRGVANDDGSGINEVVAWLNVSNTATQKITCKAGDPTNKILRQLGGQCTWEAQLTLPADFPDGKGTVHYEIKDASGNTTGEKTAEILVRRNPIQVSKITLKTKYGTDGVTYDGAPNMKQDSELNATGTVETKDFAFKSITDSKIKVEFSGGEGTVQYRLKYDGDVLEGHDLTQIGNTGTITLSKANLETIGNSVNEAPKELVLELWDAAKGYTQGTDSCNAIVTIKTLFNALDDKSPVVVIHDFHWNSEDDNSLFENSKEKGHVEIVDTPSVSGKVSIRGIAYDNINITKLTATLPNGTVTATQDTNGNWSSDKKMNNDGCEFVIEKHDVDFRGYYLKWRLDWDTEKTTVGNGKEITVIANDGTNESASSNAAITGEIKEITRTDKRYATHDSFVNAKPNQFIAFKDGDQLYVTFITEVNGKIITLKDDVPIELTTAILYPYTANKTKITVNVVPYITEIITELTSADGARSKGAFSRASTGEYPVRSDESITIKGFNLDKGKVTVGAIELGMMSGNAAKFSIRSGVVSGDVTVTVGTIKSINNMVDINKPYNSEANGANNDILNAKRKLFVWQMETLISNNAMESPQFVMDKDSNFYMSLGSLGGSSPMKFFMLKNQRLGGISDMNNSTYAYETTHSKFHNTVIGYDEAGNMYGGSTNTDKGGGTTTSFNLVAKDKPGETNNYKDGDGKRRLEGSYNWARSGGDIYDVNRVQIPKLAIRGTGTDNTDNRARIALAYYDRNNDNPPVKFRYGTVGSNPRTVDGAMDKGLGYNLETSGDCSAAGYEIVADQNTTTARSGLYVGVGLIPLGNGIDRGVVAWYDSANAKLMYSYKDFDITNYSPGTGASDATAAWQNHAVAVDGAAPLFIDLVVDDDGGVHIGYYSSGEGGVKYAYLPSTAKGVPTAGSFKVAKVDTYMNPGTFLKINVRKEGSKQVPYITYYHNGFYGSARAARIAWLKDGVDENTTAKAINGIDDNGSFTGKWVVMTVPASNGIQQYTICNGAPTGGNYEGKVIAAYFTNKNYEMAVLKK
ncbi:Ig-like domain repeat protein [Treponema phagedenis]|uniref:Ig-like domain repeat protein n=2 Tax=Treponema phagedenis TaxID=162 RepID=UPI0015A0734A|nr:Ig-like domain repeat protein [Treponema phagedenis]NVP22856.1 Ig-like domain repeat protein [Treponema phagedenis]QLC57755.1 Ig-like domain repeat protein [Treponema phagedenis]